MTIGTICSRNVDLADATESVHAIAQRMLQRNVGTVVVQDEKRRPIGILTDRDLVIKVLAHGLDGTVTTVGEIMTDYPRTVREDMPIDAALVEMRAGAFRRLPVVDEDGALVGVVSLDDILRKLAAETQMIGSLLARESPDG